MKINSIKAYPIEVPIKGSFRSSLMEINQQKHLVVKVETDEGFIGYGEVGVEPPELGGTLEGLVVTVNNYFEPALIGYDPFDIELIHIEMDKRVSGYNFAKAAIDIACYDIMGKSQNLPLYKLIGGKANEKIPLTWVIGIDSIEKNVNEAKKALKKGFSALKVKVGLNPENDVKRINEIRKAIQDNMSIRIDANQGYKPKEAIWVLRKMEDLNLQCIEQPVNKLNIKGLSQIARATSVPVMTDEAVCSLEDLIRIIEYNAASIINIKVSRVGGISKAKKIAHIAEAGNLSCILGCMLELGVGIAAAAHVAISTSNVDFQSDLIGHLYHEEDIIEESGKTSLEVEKGNLIIPEAPGLGVNVNEKMLEKYFYKN